MSTLTRFFDSVASSFSLFSNNLSGVGGNQDSAKTININTRKYNLRTGELVALYKNALVQKLVDTIPELALEADIKIIQKNNDSFDSNPIKNILESLDILQIFCNATISARLFKEAYLLLDIDDGLDLTEPVDLSKVKAFNSIYLLEKDEVTIRYEKRKLIDFRINISDTLVQQFQYIHPSRVIVISGKPISPKMKEANRNEDFSFLEGFIDSFSSLSNSVNVSANIIARFITFVFKMKGLKEILIDPESEEVIRKRLQTHKVGLGSVGGLILDSETEEVEWITSNLSGIPETITKQERLFTASTELPHDILWNEGSHSTASDLEAINTQRIVKRFINRNWKKPANYIVSLIGASQGVDNLLVDFVLPEPILTLQERTNIKKTIAETDKIYLDAGVITPTQLLALRFGELVDTNLFSDSRTFKDTKIIDAITPVEAYTVTATDLENSIKRLREESPLLEAFVMADEYTE
jgi:phage-related protein (TIGR01555 family)